MTDIHDLLRARAELLASIKTAEADLLDELESAKVEYRSNPNDDTRARHAKAVAAVKAYREQVRTEEGRTGTAVGGDAYISNAGPIAGQVRKAVG